MLMIRQREYLRTTDKADAKFLKAQWRACEG